MFSPGKQLKFDPGNSFEGFHTFILAEYDFKIQVPS